MKCSMCVHRGELVLLGITDTQEPSTGSLLDCQHFLQGPGLPPTPFSPGAELLTEHREGAQDLCGE